MTNATIERIERIARLMHETWRERYRARFPFAKDPRWETASEEARDDYRAAARAVLKALGGEP